MLTRTITGLAFAAVMAGGIFGGFYTFLLLFAVITGLTLWEFYGLVLADEIAKNSNVPDALHGFMTRRYERARLVVETSLRIGEAEMNSGKGALDGKDMAALALALQQPY